MPTVANWIDELREAFGGAEIDAVIRNGLRPDCKPSERFYASEAGYEVGQVYVPDPLKVVSAPVVGSYRLEQKGKA